MAEGWFKSSDLKCIGHRKYSSIQPADVFCHLRFSEKSGREEDDVVGLNKTLLNYQGILWSSLIP